MRVPLSWLRDYVPLDMSVEDLAQRIDISTAVVAAIERRGVPDEDGNLGLFRVGRVLEAEKHPNADRLQLCVVDVGEAEPYQIVCGAWNFGAGASVAVALPGAQLPGGLVLERRTLRGKESAGMILSERELELGDDHSGIIVLDEGEPGAPLADVLPIRDVVLDLEITGNRPDLLSVYGVAREVAALFRLDLAPPPGRDPEPAGDERVQVTVDDREGCPRYLGRLFRDVRVAPSPTWLRARLDAAGMRPISNVVDVTNYVMLGLGNPLHAFDFDTLAGGEIVVRHALGASRGRVIAQIVTEALVLALAAATLGLVVAQTTVRHAWARVNQIIGDGLPFWVDLTLEPLTIAYALLLALVAAVLIGLLPALKATRVSVRAGLQGFDLVFDALASAEEDDWRFALALAHLAADVEAGFVFKQRVENQKLIGGRSSHGAL